MRRCVGMADEGDSKSLVLITRVGSTPTTGTKQAVRTFFRFRAALFCCKSYLCVLRENADDGIGRGDLAGKIQMGINIAGGADIAVPQPLLNLFQAHAVGIKQACAAMAQIVKADTLHIVRCEELREMLAQKVGADAPAHRVDIDIIEIIRAVILAADLPVQRLLFLHLFEHLLTGRDQRKGAAAGFCLGSSAQKYAV